MRIAKRPLLIAASGVTLAALLTGGFLATHRTTHADDALPTAITREHFNPLDTFSDSSDGQMASLGTFKSASGLACVVTTAGGNTDCELKSPHNETSIAVNPTNPANLIGGANDYQLLVNSGGQVKETVFTRSHVSFDGGATWADYAITSPQYTGTGDPAVAFDADGRAYMATLGFNFTQGKGGGIPDTTADVIASYSTDGGKTWSNISRVAQGTGSGTSQGIFNDKEYIAAWGHGNAIVTYTQFNDGIKGSYISSPIFSSVTHDGGKSWSTPVEISGSAPFCLGAQASDPQRCDQDQVSIPVVAADGSIYVAFESTYDAATGRDQYLVVKVDPATGARIAGPFPAGHIVDGITDYPINVSGRQTYQDSEFRTWSAGNIAADPTNASHLAVVWSDMRNSALPAPHDPFAAVTNSDIVVSQSTDGGQTWSAPLAIAAAGDQFMPWAAYDTAGKLRIGYFDRSYDPANHKYAYTLATETAPGALSFSFANLSGVLSDPTSGDRWFSGGVPNHATTFLGDYSGIAATPSGGVVALWTDMRNSTCFTTRCGTSEDAYFIAHA